MKDMTIYLLKDRIVSRYSYNDDTYAFHPYLSSEKTNGKVLQLNTFLTNKSV